MLGHDVIQKQPLEVFYKTGVLKNASKLTGKHLYQSLFCTKVAGVACNFISFIKKETLAQVFSCVCDIFKNTYFIEYLRTTTSGHSV